MYDFEPQFLLKWKMNFRDHFIVQVEKNKIFYSWKHLSVNLLHNSMLL